MHATQEGKKDITHARVTPAAKDLAVLVFANIGIFVASYYLDVFGFLVEFFKKHPGAITWIDEIITGLVTLSIGFAIFSWRRLRELKKETTERIKLQEELTSIAEIRAETERIIGKQLHCDIEEYKKIEQDVLSRQAKVKERVKQN